MAAERRLRLSIVIPALNAAPTLADALDALEAGDEILVIDGGSTDATAAIAQARGVRVLTCGRGRGLQLAAGAEAATGDWLLFLHADTRLSRGWRAAAAAHAALEPGRAAAFRFALDDHSRQARLLERAVALRVRLLALPYGDQGLLISRALYDAVGGFRTLPFMEDVDLVRRLGRRRLAALPIDAVTSARRWREHGWARRTLINAACLTLFYLGASPAFIARLYGR